jgi:hypothetical protein
VESQIDRDETEIFQPSYVVSLNLSENRGKDSQRAVSDGQDVALNCVSCVASAISAQREACAPRSVSHPEPGR